MLAVHRMGQDTRRVQRQFSLIVNTPTGRPCLMQSMRRPDDRLVNGGCATDLDDAVIAATG